jgi:hypothetical protein
MDFTPCVLPTALICAGVSPVACIPQTNDHYLRERLAALLPAVGTILTERITVLLHKHYDAMQNKEDGVCPGPPGSLGVSLLRSEI